MKNRYVSAMMVLISLVVIVTMLIPLERSALAEELPTLFQNFLSDGRWSNGLTWTGSQTPKSFSGQWWGCAAYCADFTNYCFGKSNPRAGTAFYNTSEIRAGDVLTVGNQSDGTGHWFVCLKRSDNSLYTAEGSYANKVRVGWNYTISSSTTFSQFSSSFTAGYHFMSESSSPSVSFLPWSNDKYTYVYWTDAGIGQEINVSGGTCTKVGMYLYDNNGNYLAQASQTEYYYRIYFKINAECNYTLQSGTTYKYKFYAVVNGNTYWGPEYSFTTEGPTQYGTLDVNGDLDGIILGNVDDYGSFDVYINGSLVSDDVTDYYDSALPAGTTYEIKDIRATSGHLYDGVANGSLSGTITANSTTDVRLKFLSQYTIYFDANGGSGAPDSQIKTYGTAMTLSSTVPTRTCYTFKGWGTSATATSATYQPGDTYTENAAMTLYAVWLTPEHTEVIDKAIAPTCTETGLTEGKHCSVCNAVLVAQQEVPAKGHTPATDAAVAATCTEKGKTEGSHCSVCNAVLVAQKEVAAKGHTLNAHAREVATYTASGMEAYWECMVCKKLFSDADGMTEIQQPVVIPMLVSSAANEAIKKIDALSNNAGIADKATVDAAREAYEALTPEEKNLVSADTLSKLTNAEVSVKAAEEEAARKTAEEEAKRKAAEDQAAAVAAITQIDTLPTNAGMADNAAVEAARAAYDALTDDQKALVSAKILKKLTNAEAQVKQASSRKKLTKSNTKITVKDQTWTGKALTLKVTVKAGGKTLKKGTDYKVSYKNNIKVGTAKVTIEGKGKYAGKVTAAFRINPKKVSGLKLKVGIKQLTATWKSVKDVTGYQLEYSLTKDFKKSTKLKVKKAKTIEAELKKLKAGKVYYVRIRAYQTVSKKTYYSDWSKVVKSKKIKK